MALEIKVLGSGVLTASANTTITPDLFAQVVPGGKAQIVKSMRFVNKSTAPMKLTVTLNTSGSNDRDVSPTDVNIAPGTMYVDSDELTLEAGHKLKASLVCPTAALTVHYVISGIQRDA